MILREHDRRMNNQPSPQNSKLPRPPRLKPEKVKIVFIQQDAVVFGIAFTRSGSPVHVAPSQSVRQALFRVCNFTGIRNINEKQHQLR